MWFSLRLHDRPLLGDRFDEACSMAVDSFVCIPATVADPPSSGEGPTGESDAHLGGARVLVCSMFSRAGRASL